MAAKKQTKSTVRDAEELEITNGTREKPHETPKTTHGTLKEAQERDKMRIREKTKQEGADIALQRLKEEQERGDLDMVSRIRNINFEDSIEKQKGALDDLEDIAVVILSHFLHKKIFSVESMRNFGAFAQQDLIRKYMGLGAAINAVDRAALQKLREIAARPESALFRYIKSRWTNEDPSQADIGFLPRAEYLAEQLDIVTGTEYKLTDAPSEQESQKESNKFDVINWAKENKWKAVGATLIGAFLGYQLIKGIGRFLFGSAQKEKKAKTEGGSKLWRGIKWAAIGILTFFGIGKLLGSDKVMDFLREKGITVSEWRGVKMLDHFRKGEFKKGLETLWKGVDKNTAVHEKYADIISTETKEDVSPALLFEIGNKNYKDFMKEEYGSGFARTMKSALSMIGLESAASFIRESLEDKRKLLAVQKFFRDRREKIVRFNLPTDATVDDVFMGFEGKIPVAAVALEEAKQEEEKRSEKTTKSVKIEGSDKSLYAGLIVASQDAPIELAAFNQEAIQVFQKELIPDSDLETFGKYADDKIAEAKENILREKDPKKQRAAEEELMAFEKDLQDLQEIIETRKQALESYEDSLRKKEPVEMLAAKAQAVIEINDELREKLKSLQKREGFWTLVGGLAIGAPQILRFFQTHIGTGYYSAYGRYLGKEAFRIPFRAGKKTVDELKKLVKRERELARLKGRLAVEEALVRGQEGTYRHLIGEMGLKPANFKGNNLEKTLAQLYESFGISDERVSIKRDLMSIIRKQRETDLLRARIDALEAPLAGAAPRKMQGMVKRISDLEAEVLLLENHEVQYRANALVQDFDRRSRIMEKGFESEDFDRMRDVETRFEAHQRNIDESLRAKAALLEKTTGAAGRQKIVTEMNELIELRARLVVGSIETIDSGWKRFIRKFEAHKEGIFGNLSESLYKNAAVTRYRQFVTQMLWKMTANFKANPLVRVIPKSGKSLIFYAAAFTLGTAASKDQFTGLGTAAKQVGFDIAPVTGTYSDWYTVATGKEKFTGREVTGTERWALRPIFGVAGALADITTFAGVGLGFRAFLSGLKTARGVSKVGKFSKALKEARTAKTAAEENKIYKGLTTANRNIGRRLAVTGFAGGLTMTLVPIATASLSDETQELLKGTVKDVSALSPVDMPSSSDVEGWLTGFREKVDMKRKTLEKPE